MKNFFIKLDLLQKSWQSSLVKLINSIFWSLGILLSVVTGIDLFFETWAQKHIMPLWWLFLITGIIIALVRSLPKISIAYKIDNTDTFVEIQIGDIFDTTESMVVGTNTTFDTTVEKGVISPKSIQGKFTKKYCASVTELDQKLNICLQNIESEQLAETQKNYGKTKKYPIGTVAKIDSQSRTGYFVAIAHMNRTGNAYSTTQNVLDALPNLWEFIRSQGEFGDICMPIIGAGFSRVQATKEVLLQEILRSFIAACSEGKFCEKLTLFIHPDDIKNNKINFDDHADFLKYVCTYENKRSGSQSIETSRSKIADDSPRKKQLKVACFLLEDDKTRQDFKEIVENIADSIEKAISTLLEAKNFTEFVEKCNRSLTVTEELEFLPHKQPQNPEYKKFSTGMLPPNYRKKIIWALDVKNNIYLNNIANNLFNSEFVKLKDSIE